MKFILFLFELNYNIMKKLALFVLLMSVFCFGQDNSLLDRLSVLENNGKLWYNIDGYSVTSEEFSYPFNEEGLKKCQFFDAYGGCKAKINKEPIIYPCHAGLTDFASPIILGETQVGCFLCGQVLTEKPDEEKFRNYAKELKIDEDKYIEALRKVKILPYERIEYIADFLYKISSKMSTFIFYQNMGISANKFYKNTIDEFHKQLESDKDNKLESEKNSLKNILDKILETLKGNYEVNEKELFRINKMSDEVSKKSSSIIKNIQETIKNFKKFDIS